MWLKKPTTGIFLLTIMILLTSITIGPQILLANGAPLDEDIEIPEKDTGNKRLVLASDAFQIEISGGGQVPFYHFNTSNPQLNFFLKLQQIVQYEDSNDNGIYDESELIGGAVSTLQLPSVDWELNIITESASEVQFVLVSSGIRDPLFSGATIELMNYFTAGSTAIKFDVNITNWPFVETATGLSLEFELSWNSPGENDQQGTQLDKTSSETGIYLQAADETVVASFESVSDITVDGQLVVDGAVLSDTANSNAPKLNIFINYPRFDESLLHDPTIGASLESLENPATIVLRWLQENVKDGFLGLTVMTTLVLVILWGVNRRKH